MHRLLLFMLLSSPIFSTGQNAYVKILPISKYGFEVKNQSQFNLIIKVGSLEHEVFQPGYQKKFETALFKQETIQLFYSYESYLSMKNMLTGEMAKLGVAQTEINQLSQELIFNRDRSPRVTTDMKYDYADGVDQPYSRMETLSETATRNLMTDAFIGLAQGLANERIEKSKLTLKSQYSENEALYAASTGANNEFKEVFAPIPISTYTSKGKGKHGISPRFAIELEYGFKVTDISPAWQQGSDLKASFSFPLAPEIKLGNSNFFIRPYGFIGFIGNDWKLNTKTGPYYVSSDYTNSNTADYFELQNMNKISISSQQYLGGAFLKLYLRNYFFLDFGIGANSYFYASSLNFDSTGHIKNAKLREKKFKDIYHNNGFFTDNYHLLFKGGFLFGKKKGREYQRYKGLGLTVGVRLHKDNRAATDNYGLYRNLSGEKVLVESTKPTLSYNAGVNFHF